MSISKKILIIAGEESGDMYGANIIQKLSKNQNITFYAMGSSKMQMTSAKIVVDSSKLSVVGFFEILRIVSCNKEILDSNFNNCLGLLVLEIGHNLVPDPPHKIIA